MVIAKVISIMHVNMDLRMVIAKVLSIIAVLGYDKENSSFSPCSQAWSVFICLAIFQLGLTACFPLFESSNSDRAQPP